MNELKVIFLDEEYTFPTDVIRYFDFRREFSKMQQDFLRLVLSGYGDIDNWDAIEKLENSYKTFASNVVQKLYAQGVYNRTVDDLLKNNKGYSLVQTLIREAMETKLNIATEQIEGIISDAERANEIASSEVTGMGFSVYTSSFISLAVYAAMEKKTLEEQTEKAEQVYQQLVDKAVQKGEERAKKKTADYVANQWLPGLKLSVSLFATGVFESFIFALIEKGDFDEKVLNYIDFKRCEDLLNNVSYAADKRKLLGEAFGLCPWCLKTYLKVIDLGWYHENENFCADQFHVSEAIVQHYREKCYEIARQSDEHEKALIWRFKPYVDKITMVNKNTKEAEMEICFSERRALRLKALSDFRESMNVNTAIDKFLREHVSEHVYKIIEFSNVEGNFKNLFLKHIDSVILNYDNLDYYREAKEQAINYLIWCAERYVIEAKRRKTVFNLKLDDYYEVCDYVSAEIRKINIQKYNLGAFEFKEESRLDREIKLLEKKRAAVVTELVNARNKYVNMYRECC